MNMTPAEQQQLDKIAAAQAAGQDVFGDNDTEADAAAAQAAQAAKAAEDAAAQAQADEAAAGAHSAEGDKPSEAGEGEKPAVDGMDAAVLEEIANHAALPRQADPLNFAAQVPQDYKAQRQALMAEKNQAMGKLMEGEIDASEFAAIDARVADALEDLTAARIRAETLQEASAQSHAQYQQQQIASLAHASKKSGEIDYVADATAQIQFDIAITGLKADPDNAGKDFAELVQQAHTAVLAMRGIAKKTAAAPASAAPPADRKPEGQVPVTLRNLPAAASSNTGGSITDQLATLKGPEYETAFAKLTPQQRAAMLDE